MKSILIFFSLFLPFSLLSAGDLRDNLSLSGKIKTRYEHTSYSGIPTPGRDRGILFFIAGGTLTLNKYISVSASIASGAGKPASNNITLSDGFQGRPIHLETAEIRIHPLVEWITLSVGKMKNPLLRPGGSPMMWDSDVTPEGVGGSITWKLTNTVSLLGAGGFFLLNEDSKLQDSFMAVAQAGVQVKISGVDVTAFGGYHNALKNTRVLSHHTGGNTTIDDSDAETPLRYNADFDVVEGAAAANTRFFNYLSTTLIFHFTENVSRGESDTTAYLFGTDVGSSVFEKLGHWKFHFDYRHVERDAFLDLFSDSGFNSGITGANGTTVSAGAVLYNPLSLKFLWGHYRSFNTNRVQNIIKIDLCVRF